MNIYIDDSEVEELLRDYKRNHYQDEDYDRLSKYIIAQVLNQLGLSLEEK